MAHVGKSWVILNKDPNQARVEFFRENKPFYNCEKPETCAREYAIMRTGPRRTWPDLMTEVTE